jgi:hypothetical protein
MMKPSPVSAAQDRKVLALAQQPLELEDPASSSHPPTRASLRVIGAGFGRTGTLSLKAALERLGFGPCYHMTEMLLRPDDAPIWLSAARGEPVDWTTVPHGYAATVDWPASAFYGELLAANPDAKVILTVRDPERWYESVLSTIYETRTATRPSPRAALLDAALRLLDPALALSLRVMDEVIWQGIFENRFEDRDYAIGRFVDHIREVREAVPAGKLLVFAAAEGWEPLCRFLEVPVPDVPFPHINDRETYARAARRRLWARLNFLTRRLTGTPNAPRP